jgi:hypothetical protein
MLVVQCRPIPSTYASCTCTRDLNMMLADLKGEGYVKIVNGVFVMGEMW